MHRGMLRSKSLGRRGQNLNKGSKAMAPPTKIQSLLKQGRLIYFLSDHLSPTLRAQEQVAEVQGERVEIRGTPGTGQRLRTSACLPVSAIFQ